MAVSVQEADFDAGAEIAALSAGRPEVGAVASFVGLVRDVGHGAQVTAMTLEHYPGMTEQSLAGIVAEAERRWRLHGVRVIHRYGRLLPCDRIVFVGVASAHRGDAFAACEFIMDYLKTRAPFWKREETPDGAHWVDAREADDEAAARWDESWEAVDPRR
ncbi:molybdopterin synthase catalytic subunit MoaE [Pseudothauera rhizosphaerae]|uniref:Molybdopterin synthase catalytic subunit n=1 Tax=Pseudothauera rhizosphaerae TaxID=2565932 RepID=A0A4S4ATZ4_9RHOO|nr:molybdopterin synthase catalytic subunit MoaE [Pseudothauera rhizosphaerae]THF63391.1 molybdopterin synthase catalytic subunit MoaE [Pseudothauera rhizosphaerae]